MKRKDFALIALLIAVDQLVKYYISSSMALYESIEVIKNFFYITYVRNDGAAFSILQGQRVFFLILALVVCIGLCIYIHKENITGFEKIGVLLVIGGAAGNAVDRAFTGTVVDFLDFILFGYDYPVFNVADIFITIGVVLMVVCTLFNRKEVH